jgi:hypothetical protein
MHEEKEQTQIVVGGSDSFFLKFRVFILEKENNTEKSTLTVIHSGDLARLPLGQISIEGRCFFKRCKECATISKENDNTPT